MIKFQYNSYADQYTIGVFSALSPFCMSAKPNVNCSFRCEIICRFGKVIVKLHIRSSVACEILVNQ
jgi:hypothetical protein